MAWNRVRTSKLQAKSLDRLFVSEYCAGMHDMLNSLWFGDELGYLERLSIKTALAAGHPYTLYSYEPDQLRGVPAGIEVKDAREVMDDPRRLRHFEGKFKALGSDFFRYEI